MLLADLRRTLEDAGTSRNVAFAFFVALGAFFQWSIFSKNVAPDVHVRFTTRPYGRCCRRGSHGFAFLHSELLWSFGATVVAFLRPQRWPLEGQDFPCAALARLRDTFSWSHLRDNFDALGNSCLVQVLGSASQLPVGLSFALAPAICFHCSKTLVPALLQSTKNARMEESKTTRVHWTKKPTERDPRLEPVTSLIETISKTQWQTLPKRRSKRKTIIKIVSKR